MSWSDKRRLRALAALGGALLLSGCLKPMYGGVEGAALRDDLSAIAIDPIPDRSGHYLANELRFLLNGTGASVPPRYKLQIALREQVQSTLVDTVTGRATAGSIVIDAEYRLLPIAGGPPIASGLATSISSYDRTSQRFANIRAARDAQIRDAKVLADQIKTRLAVALSRG